MIDDGMNALSESEYALALADVISETMKNGADAVAFGPTDAVLIEKLLRARGAT